MFTLKQYYPHTKSTIQSKYSKPAYMNIFPFIHHTSWKKNYSIVTLQTEHDFTHSNSGQSYEIWQCVASDSGASELIARAEKTAMWFIETADSVDFADLRWSAVLLFQAHASGTAT